MGRPVDKGSELVSRLASLCLVVGDHGDRQGRILVQRPGVIHGDRRGVRGQVRAATPDRAVTPSRQ